MENVDRMTKVILKAQSEQELVDLSRNLTQNEISHYSWREEPEKVITAVASAPNERDVLKPHFSQFKLFR